MHPGQRLPGHAGGRSGCGADAAHYPGTYLAGVYNRLQTALDGQTVEDEHLVNAPNWLPLRFAPAEGEWLTPDSAELLDYGQTAGPAARRADAGRCASVTPGGRPCGCIPSG